MFYLVVVVFAVIADTYGQIPWNSGVTTLNRVPGLHPVGASVQVPEFLASRAGNNHERRCPNVDRNCPKQCRVLDNNKCRICDCNLRQEMTSSERVVTSCPNVPSDCPSGCRKLDEHKCRICKCHQSATEEITGSGLHGAISGSPFGRCYSMVMCMLSCKQGYTLGTSSNDHGCQPCRCVQADGEANASGVHGVSSISSSATNENAGGEWSWGVHGGSSVWQATDGTSGFSGNSDGRQEYGTGSGDRWVASHVSASQNGDCSGPQCPGSSGVNPLSPGSSMTSSSRDDKGHSSCSGPFCLGQGGGMTGTVSGMGSSGSGSSSCTGPFCMTSSSGAGTGTGSRGSSSPGGMMGGPGGTGAFSPFGLAASGSAGGCNGPFCTMAGNADKTSSHASPKPGVMS